MFVVSGSAQCKAPERDACKKSRDEVEVEVEVGKGWEAEKPRGVAQKGASTSRGSSRDHERVKVTPQARDPGRPVTALTRKRKQKQPPGSSFFSLSHYSFFASNLNLHPAASLLHSRFFFLPFPLFLQRWLGVDGYASGRTSTANTAVVNTNTRGEVS